MAEQGGSDKTQHQNNNEQREKNTATLSKINNAIKGNEKLDVEGTDLLELLSHLEGELQARDVVIAALKSEQLKRVLYGCYTGKPNHDSPLSALQRDNYISDAKKVEDELGSSSSRAETQLEALQTVIHRQRDNAVKLADCLRQSERRRSELAAELEAEKSKHEDDTAQGDDITYELEKDRTRLRLELEQEVLERKKLELGIKENTSKTEEEKSKQKQIVLVLLSDRKKLHKLYLEEKKRSEDLAQMLEEERAKMETMAVGLEEESKRSLAMEAELEKHLAQFGSERQQLRDKVVADERRYRDLEDALRKARSDVEHFKKQLAEAHRVAMSQASPQPPPYPGTNNLATSVHQQQQLSVSPTPLPTGNRPIATQSYATYSNYSTYAQIGNVNSTSVNAVGGQAASSHGSNTMMAGGGGSQVPRTGPLTSTAVNMSRATQGNPVVRSLSGNIPPQASLQQQQQQKFHPASYNSAGGYGHSSHPAMMGTGGTLSHLDQDVIPSDIYSQINKPTGGIAKSSTSTGVNVSAASAGIVRKPAAEMIAAGSRKPGLGKGVPPPVPPNKPVVPVKKEIGGSGKRVMTAESVTKDLGLSMEAGKQSMVTGLQGLKFGISIGGGGGDAGKGIKPLTDPVTASALTAKKFFNNIESKS